MSKLLSAFWCLSLPMIAMCSTALAADQATLDRLVNYAKEACLVGTHIELKADVSGNITLRNLLRPGAEGAINAKHVDASGATAYIDEQTRLIADRQIQECLRPFMLRIFEAVLGTEIQPSPGMPSRELLRAPESAAAAETVDFRTVSVALYSCSNQRQAADEEILVCFFVLTSSANGAREYEVDDLIDWRPKLIDNFRIEHDLLQLYLLNGRGQQQSTVNLDDGDAVWFAAEFANGANDINTARIVFEGVPGDPQLRAPVKLSEQ